MYFIYILHLANFLRTNNHFFLSLNLFLICIFNAESISKTKKKKFFITSFFLKNILTLVLVPRTFAQNRIWKLWRMKCKSWSCVSESTWWPLKKKSTCHFLTFILKCNETQGKVDPGVIILYNIPGDSFQKVILAVSKYQYQKQGRKSECCCWLWLSGVGDVGPAAKVCVLRGKNYLPEWGIALSQSCQYNRKLP